jgi:sugar fermentation stimulation protein A
MKLTKKLIKAKILNRYKRFLADVELENGDIITVHVPNTGRMTTCWEHNWDCVISDSENPKRKYRYTLEMTSNGKTWIVVNTGIPNSLAEDFIANNRIPGLENYDTIKREVKYGENSRIDLLLQRGEEKCFVEVKNVTLVENNIAYFPDAPSDRAIKHLKELEAEVQKGNRAVMLYLITREDAIKFMAANHIDPRYSVAVKKAMKNGVEVIPVLCKVNIDDISFDKVIEYSND